MDEKGQLTSNWIVKHVLLQTSLRAALEDCLVWPNRIVCPVLPGDYRLTVNLYLYNIFVTIFLWYELFFFLQLLDVEARWHTRCYLGQSKGCHEHWYLRQIWLFCIPLCEKEAWANQTQYDKEEFIASSLEWRVQDWGEENLVIITYLLCTTEGKNLESPEFSLLPSMALVVSMMLLSALGNRRGWIEYNGHIFWQGIDWPHNLYKWHI